MLGYEADELAPDFSTWKQLVNPDDGHDASQFVVDDGKQVLSALKLALFDPLQDEGYVFHGEQVNTSAEPGGSFSRVPVRCSISPKPLNAKTQGRF